MYSICTLLFICCYLLKCVIIQMCMEIQSKNPNKTYIIAESDVAQKFKLSVSFNSCHNHFSCIIFSNFHRLK